MGARTAEIVLTQRVPVHEEDPPVRDVNYEPYSKVL